MISAGTPPTQHDKYHTTPHRGDDGLINDDDGEEPTDDTVYKGRLFMVLAMVGGGQGIIRMFSLCTGISIDKGVHSFGEGIGEGRGG